MPKSFLITDTKEAQKYIDLSGYVTDNDGSFDGLEMNGEVNQRADINCMEEEADCRLILHVADAKVERLQNVPGVILKILTLRRTFENIFTSSK